MKNLTPNQKLWLDALRSGEYKQGQDELHITHVGKNYFCCLGVAAKIFADDTTDIRTTKNMIYSLIYSYDGCGCSAPEYVVEALGLVDDTGRSLSGANESLSFLNDTCCSFEQIADHFEQNLEDYTK